MLLKNVKVLDLTRLAPGPFCTMTLGDMGADVLKVEDTGFGDYMRTTGYMKNEESFTFLALNRNKRSITLDLKSAKGKEVLFRLLKEYDVLVEQFRPGVMERLGLGYDTLKEINPRLIFCSLTGYGQTGPYKNKVGHDLNYVSETGILHAFTDPAGKPVFPGIYLGDMMGGIWSVIGILAAVVYREQSGKGQYIDVSIFDSLFPLMNLYASRFFNSGSYRYWGPIGPWYDVYETKDHRYITIGSVEQKFWETLCDLIGMPHLKNSMKGGDREKAELRRELEEVFRSKTQKEWSDLLTKDDTMYAPVLNIEEAFEDPHFSARKMCWEMEHPTEGSIRSIGFPVKFREDPADVTHRPPMYSEHTEAVMSAVGYSEEEIQAMREQGVIR